MPGSGAMRADTGGYVDSRYPLSEQTGQIIAAAQEVYHTLGPGFEEVFYQQALAMELQARGLDVSREVNIEVLYKGVKLGTKRVDFVVDEVMVEIKARAAIEDVHFVQALSYLKASGYAVGLLLNFGGPKLEIKRLMNRA